MVLRERRESTVILQVEGAPGPTGLDAADRRRIDLNLPMRGGCFRASLHVADRRIALSGLVPVARALTTELALAVLKDLDARGTAASCRKGCSACCGYLVPLSAPEAFAMRGEIESLPVARRRRVGAAHLAAAETVLSARPPIPLADPHGADGEHLGEVAAWYADLGLDCPFLSDNVCSVYDRRPLACREHLVTCDPACCASGAMTGEAGRVALPVSVAEAMMALSAEMQRTHPAAVMLPVALLWAQQHADQDEQRRPARQLAERFVEILHDRARDRAAKSRQVA